MATVSAILSDDRKTFIAQVTVGLIIIKIEFSSPCHDFVEILSKWKGTDVFRTVDICGKGQTFKFGIIKLQLTWQNLGRIFNTRCGYMCVMHLCCCESKWPNLKLKTWPEQFSFSALSFCTPQNWAVFLLNLYDFCAFYFYETYLDLMTWNCSKMKVHARLQHAANLVITSYLINNYSNPIYLGCKELKSLMLNVALIPNTVPKSTLAATWAIPSTLVTIKNSTYLGCNSSNSTIKLIPLSLVAIKLIPSTLVATKVNLFTLVASLEIQITLVASIVIQITMVVAIVILFTLVAHIVI